MSVLTDLTIMLKQKHAIHFIFINYNIAFSYYFFV